MENQKQTTAGQWLKESLTAKAILIIVLTLAMCIPLSKISDLINERAQRQSEVVESINSKWGNEVCFYGPMLKIPYTKEAYVYDERSKNNVLKLVTSYVYLLPEKIDLQTAVNTKAKKYGIYKSIIYNCDANIKGKFNTESLNDLKFYKLDYQSAKVIYRISNIKGISSTPIIKVNNQSYELVNQDYQHAEMEFTFYELGTKTIDAGISPIIDFDLTLALNGSGAVSFIPIGKETVVNLKSNWTNASFVGEFLPKSNNSQAEKSGTNANWNVLAMNTPFKRYYEERTPEMSSTAFGVNFIPEVNEYLKTERTAKYGLLVIGLTLLCFFLIQVSSKINIHPLQYLMIGFALVLFYILLLSISEHIGFNLAYLIAGAAIILLISLYAKAIFQKIRTSLFLGTSLTILFLFLFVIIQLQSYSLLVGSIGLFLILAFVMYSSKKIDWTSKSTTN